ncbi:MAG: UDP-N-acetylmuramoylalanine--D-glutamate ligase, UDP-N-acetylmuramoylalanine--D-glutamate ligase [Candidatus Berkelbacteria bacterium]|nr:UDP-N-acetylmuramoylalanine--D-glutamate ligase, UDP-N-acetylmuramoylalanine--D-glutamate ligase [Candidatus Berkelbacteria bacterium]
MEFIKEIDGVKYYNDSFSTTPDTTIAAIKSFREPIILFLGGSEKNADYSELIKIINSSTVKMVISIGLTSKRVVEKIRNPKIKIVKNTQPISNAVKLAKENSQSGDVILLSPASASFDRFANYKDRGEKFCKEVLK